VSNASTAVLVLSNFCSLGCSIIEVRVGKGDHLKKFTVHKNLITSRSQFFADTLHGNWKEIEDNGITLDEDDPKVFELYMELLYRGTLPMDDLFPGGTNQSDNNASGCG